jgi:hypothetical protein
MSEHEEYIHFLPIEFFVEVNYLALSCLSKKSVHIKKESEEISVKISQVSWKLQHVF